MTTTFPLRRSVPNQNHNVKPVNQQFACCCTTNKKKVCWNRDHSDHNKCYVADNIDLGPSFRDDHRVVVAAFDSGAFPKETLPSTVHQTRFNINKDMLKKGQSIQDRS